MMEDEETAMPLELVESDDVDPDACNGAEEEDDAALPTAAARAKFISVMALIT